MRGSLKFFLKAGAAERVLYQDRDAPLYDPERHDGETR